jgi:transposase
MAGSRIALEVGTHSPWVSRYLRAMGREVIVANARKVITQSVRKNDRIDAEQLARLARVDLWSPIRHGPEQAQVDLAMIRARSNSPNRGSRQANRRAGSGFRPVTAARPVYRVAPQTCGKPADERGRPWLEHLCGTASRQRLTWRLIVGWIRKRGRQAVKVRDVIKAPEKARWHHVGIIRVENVKLRSQARAVGSDVNCGAILRARSTSIRGSGRKTR